MRHAWCYDRPTSATKLAEDNFVASASIKYYQSTLHDSKWEKTLFQNMNDNHRLCREQEPVEVDLFRLLLFWRRKYNQYDVLLYFMRFFFLLFPLFFVFSISLALCTQRAVHCKNVTDRHNTGEKNVPKNTRITLWTRGWSTTTIRGIRIRGKVDDKVRFYRHSG